MLYRKVRYFTNKFKCGGIPLIHIKVYTSYALMQFNDYEGSLMFGVEKQWGVGVKRTRVG